MGTIGRRTSPCMLPARGDEPQSPAGQQYLSSKSAPSRVMRLRLVAIQCRSASCTRGTMSELPMLGG